MARFLVTNRRNVPQSSISALDAVTAEPGVKVLNSTNPEMVTIEASEEAADQLRTRLKGSHYVEPEFRRSLD